MPIFNVRTPDGSLMKINGPEDATDEELIQIAEQNYVPPPSLFKRAKTALGRGIEQIPESIAGLTLGAEAGLGFKEAAAKKLEQIKAEQAKPQAGAPGITWEELEKTYGTEGAVEALKKLPAYVVEQILQNAPSMAAPLAVGAAATPFTSPVGGLLAGIGTYGLQQAGQFMQRQAEQAKTVEELEPGKAFGVAAVTAPLGFFVDRLTLGMSKVPTKVLGTEIMAELGKRAGVRAATGATLGVVAEAPTEVLEQMAERWQANLPLFDDAAIKEYKEAAAGAAVVGGIAGGVSRFAAPPTPVVPPAAEIQPPAAALVEPEAPVAPGGFTAEEAQRLRNEAAQIEQTRAAAAAAQEQARREAAFGEREARMPGITGAPDANQAMMDALRRRQAEEERARAQEAQAQAQAQQAEAEARQAEQIKRVQDYQAEVARIQSTRFHPDPYQNRVTQSRMIRELGPEPKMPKPPARPAEEPKYEPITAPQEVPKGAQTFRFTPEEQQYIDTLKTNLTDINKQITEAKKQKTSLFTRLTGELASRPGAFSVKDIVSSNKNLSKLFNKKGQGRLLEDMIADGSLDEFLPQKNRAIINGQQNPNFDPAGALNHIATKLGSGDYRSTAEAETLDYLGRQKEDLQKELDYVQALPDVNAELARRAGVPKKPVEPVAIADLEAQAQKMGVDTEAIKERLAVQNPNATQAQYMGLYNQALTAATGAGQSYTIDGYQYTAEELEDAITERLTNEQIDEYIAQAEAEQEELARRAQADRARREAAAAPQRTTEVEPGVAEISVPPTTAQNVKLGQAIEKNDWAEVAGQMRLSQNPIISNIGRLAEGLKGVNTEINARVLASNPRAVAGWSPQTNNIYFKSTKYARSEAIAAHETVHALTYFAIHNPTAAQKPVVRRLDNLFRYVKDKMGRRGRGVYGLTSLDEFIAEANSDADFQKELAKIPYQNKTAWGAFTKIIADLLGIKNSNALTEVIALTEELTSTESQTGKPSRRRLIGAEEEITIVPKKEEAAVSPELARRGAAGVELIDSINRGPKAPALTASETIGNMVGEIRKMSPQQRKDRAIGIAQRFEDYVGTKIFSSDTALQNSLERYLRDSGGKEIVGQLLENSTSQASQANGFASAVLWHGAGKYNNTFHKWEAFHSDTNMKNVFKIVGDIAKKYGISKEYAGRIFHTAAEAARTKELNERNADIENKIRSATTQEEVNRLQKQIKNTENMEQHEIDVGMTLFEIYPELRDVVKNWNGFRSNILDIMVEGGLYNREEAELLLDSAAYVPFYREDQLEQGMGPKHAINSLRVAADKRLKGSKETVNDILDNMVRWAEYAVSRSVRARSARVLAEGAAKAGLGHEINEQGVSIKENMPPVDPKDPHVIKIWRDGQQRMYYLEDPLWVEAFTGLESVALPLVGIASKFTKALRNSIVLYPIFSVAQVPQDSFAAMFSSGLKPQYAMKIPFLAVKEFIQTIRGKSELHDKLRRFGVSGLYDQTADAIRNNFEAAFGVIENPSIIQRAKMFFGNIATASDNAVRQAVYQASLDAGLTEGEAIEKSFEIFNPHRRGTSKELAIASKLIPFFNAYLAVQNVAYKTLTGKGTSPSDRQAALTTLLQTSASVFIMSMIYAAMNADDDDYLRKPTPTRDRLLMIPGTGGASIPIRPDLFSMTKILGEHLYLLLSDNGFEDGAKFRSSMGSAMTEALLSPTLLPQIIKPAFETAINYDFFQKKPIVGIYSDKDTSRQFDQSTSELSKLLGHFGISPMKADHFIRGYTGSLGGLVLYITNPMIAAATGQPRPEVSMSDAVATLPGMSGFMEKSYESALRHDFYALREEVGRVSNTIADLKANSPQDIAEYLSDPVNRARYELSPFVNRIAGNLTQIRKQINMISQAPDDKISPSEKQERIQKLRNVEEDYLKSVNLKALRERAQM